MGNVRIVLNRAGIAALLKSPEIADDMKQRAERIAEAAGPGVEVHTEIGKHRARAAVVTATPDADVANAQHHTLLRALDAGRG